MLTFLPLHHLPPSSCILCSYALYSWLDERNANVYPNMKGYKPTAAMGGGFLDINTPQKLPDAMRADQFAFVSLPLSEVMTGGDVTNENIGVGKLCPIPPNLDPDTMLSGILFITRRYVRVMADYITTSGCSFLSCLQCFLSLSLPSLPAFVYPLRPFSRLCSFAIAAFSLSVTHSNLLLCFIQPFVSS